MDVNFYYADQLEVEKPSNNNFYLHNHDFYEIYMFEKGDAECIIEENTYSLEPDDVIILRPYNMHRVYHKSGLQYKRTLLQIDPEFFDKNKCKAYEEAFLGAAGGQGSKISADIVQKTGLKEAFGRLKKYSNDFQDIYSPVVKSIVVEILYLISNISSFSVDDNNTNLVKDIILYINNNFSENINLDSLAEKFYISKYYICKIFKEATGHTVHSYITRKRLTKVRELRKEGKSLGEAAYLSGFGNYTSFYRAYLKEYGVSPKKV